MQGKGGIMEFCSVRKERVGNYTDGDPSFYDQVLSWSIADIFDENLFKDKVCPSLHVYHLGNSTVIVLHSAKSRTG